MLITIILLTWINFWSKSFSHFSNFVPHAFTLFTIFVQFGLVGVKIWQMNFLICNIYLSAHTNSKSLWKGLEINIPSVFRIKNIFHNLSYFALCDIDFICKKVIFKIFVGDKTITIFVKFAINLIHFVFSIKDFIFNISHDCSNTTCICFIFLVESSCISLI